MATVLQLIVIITLTSVAQGHLQTCLIAVSEVKHVIEAQPVTAIEVVVLLKASHWPSASQQIRQRTRVAVAIITATPTIRIDIRSSYQNIQLMCKTAKKLLYSNF